jgi:radical SAM protein with 4Fe4S-binding SPASM domain
VEEKHGYQECSMADNIGILSNGEIICCCLDVEGDMRLGNLNENDFDSPAVTKKLESVRENALSQKLCRRCKGYVVIAERSPLQCDSQKIIHFSQDWHPYEADMYGRGGRWSKELSTVFIYSRIDADYIKIEAELIREKTQCSFRIFQMENYNWIEKERSVISCGQGYKNLRIEYVFERNNFYKIEISCPTFNPAEVWKKGESRHIGIAVTNMSINKF